MLNSTDMLEGMDGEPLHNIYSSFEKIIEAPTWLKPVLGYLSRKNGNERQALILENWTSDISAYDAWGVSLLKLCRIFGAKSLGRNFCIRYIEI